MDRLRLMRSTAKRRRLADPRQIAVSDHCASLAARDPAELLALVRSEPGAWPIVELATTAFGSAELSVTAWRLLGSEGEQVLFVVSHRGRFGRRFADGFAVVDGVTRALTDDEWGWLD